MFYEAHPANFYNLFKLKRKNVDGRRHYITPEGNVYPSVTTMLKVLGSDGIDEWRKRVGEARADEISHRATTTGTRVHKAVEVYLNNQVPDFDSIFVKAHFDNIKPLLQNINKIKSLEAHLYSDSLQLAGQVDCVAEYNEVPSIIDFKTSSKKKKEEWIEKYFLQATAYGMMWEELTKEDIPQIAILITGEDGSLEEYVKPKRMYEDRLMEVLEMYREKKNGVL